MKRCFFVLFYVYQNIYADLIKVYFCWFPKWKLKLNGWGSDAKRELKHNSAKLALMSEDFEVRTGCEHLKCKIKLFEPCQNGGRVVVQKVSAISFSLTLRQAPSIVHSRSMLLATKIPLIWLSKLKL